MEAVTTVLFGFLINAAENFLNACVMAMVVFLSTIILLLTYYSTVDTLVQVVAVSNKSFDALANYSLGDQAHSEGENCIIVSGSTSPGPSAIKVWYHKPVSAPLYSLYII